MRPFHGRPSSALVIGSEARLSSSTTPRARRRRVVHGALGAALPPQETGQTIATGRQPFGRARLHDLSDAKRALDGQYVRPTEQGQIRDTFGLIVVAF